MFTTRCFVLTAATLCSMNCGLPIKSIENIFLSADKQFHRLGDALDVRLWPYGKATTKKFDPLSNRNSRKSRQRPRIQDGIDISKELAQQKSTTSGEYSFDLELGASASKVYQRQKEKEMMESLKPSSCDFVLEF